MVQMLCIACGSKVAFRVKSCTCGHVMAENLVVPDVSSLYWKLRRHNNEGVRKLTAKLKPKSFDKKSEVRKFYLSKDKELRCVKKFAPKKQAVVGPVNISKKRKGMLLLEERKRKILTLMASPQYQEKLSLALMKINKKLLSQKIFSALISTDSLKSNHKKTHQEEYTRQIERRRGRRQEEHTRQMERRRQADCTRQIERRRRAERKHRIECTRQLRARSK